MAWYTIELDPTLDTGLHVYRYTEVRNTPQLLQAAREGTLRCALLDARVIHDPLQITVAANKAALALKDGTMVTRTVYSEIVFNVSPTKNITKTLATFGPKADSDALVVAILHNRDRDNEDDAVLSMIDGIPCDDQRDLADVDEVRRAYNLDGDENILSKIITMCTVKN